jgi:hypothetical protein
MTLCRSSIINTIIYHPWLSNTIFLPVFTTTIYEKQSFFKISSHKYVDEKVNCGIEQNE